MKRIRLGIVRTHYGHWSARSGYGLLGEYLRRVDGLDVVEFVTHSPSVRSGNNPNPVAYSGTMPWYTVEDHATECLVQGAVARGGLDLVHFFDGEHGYYFSERLSRPGGCRMVATYHQPDDIVRRGRLLGSGAQLAGLDRVVILSESQRSVFNAFFADPRIACIPHGVDVDFYTPDQSAQNGRHPFRCLTVGFWLRDLDVIAGVAATLSRRQDIQFTLVGLRAGLDNAAVDSRTFRRLQDLPNVELLDGIDDGELRCRYRSADIFFLPLRDCTANNVLLEAIACGLPVVTANIPGTRFYLSDGCAAFCPPGDVGAFVKALLDLKGNDGERKQMGTRARTLAESRYGWAKIAARYADLYMSIMDEAPMAPPKTPFHDIPARRAICTVISSDYLHLALALYYSIREHTQCDFYALVADNHWSGRLMERVKKDLPQGFHLLSREDVSSGSFHLEDEDSLRWALKPTLMQFLLEKQNHDAVIFADSDVCFFADIGFLFDALRTHTILLTPHWRPIDPGINEVQFRCNLQHGLYNGGFVGAGKKGIDALRWWEHVCRYRCEKRVTEGFYVDQKYLDFLPIYFDGVKILKHKGCNVAEWNADHLPRISLDGRTFVENWPVVFIHFTDLTMQGVENGKDAALLPYLETYRSYLQRADRDIAEHQWHLLAEEDSGAAPIVSAPLHGCASMDCFAWCAVVNFLEVPHFLLQWESLKEHTAEQHPILIGCADYESRCFLKALNVPDFHIVPWESLESHRLYKQRQRHDGDDHGFRKIATPFFLRHFCTHCNAKKILYLANNIVFTSSPETWFAELCQQQETLVLSSRATCSTGNGRSEPTSVFLWLHEADRQEILERWQTQLIRHTSGSSVTPIGMVDEPDIGEAGWGDPVRRRWIAADNFSGQEKSQTLFTESPAVCYDDAGFLLHDWQAFHGATLSDASFSSPLQQRMISLLERVRKRYGLSRATDLDPILEDIPKHDMARIASLHGIYLKDFGERIREPWNGPLSTTMNAYLLYLMAVNDRQTGRTDRALTLFRAVAGTKTLMPDLYRSKAHHHLGQMAEMSDDNRQALLHYAACLKRTPHHVEAQERISALREQAETDALQLKPSVPRNR